MPCQPTRGSYNGGVNRLFQHLVICFSVAVREMVISDNFSTKLGLLISLVSCS